MAPKAKASDAQPKAKAASKKRHVSAIEAAEDVRQQKKRQCRPEDKSVSGNVEKAMRENAKKATAISG